MCTGHLTFPFRNGPKWTFNCTTSRTWSRNWRVAIRNGGNTSTIWGWNKAIRMRWRLKITGNGVIHKTRCHVTDPNRIFCVRRTSRWRPSLRCCAFWAKLWFKWFWINVELCSLHFIIIADKDNFWGNRQNRAGVARTNSDNFWQVLFLNTGQSHISSE